VLGAGDAFMSGFLRGWLKDEPLKTCATWANACGAFAVSRLLCSPEYPTWAELSYFLKNGSKHRALRKDEAINHIHWATTAQGNSAADGAGDRPPLATDQRLPTRSASALREDRRLQAAGRRGGRRARQPWPQKATAC
jgi:hypothetical protein